MNSFHTVLRCIKRIATDTVNGFHRTRTLGSCAKMKVFEIFLFLLHLVAEKHSPGFFCEEFSRRMRQIVSRVVALVLRGGTSTVIWPRCFFFFFFSTAQQFNQCTPSVLLLHQAALGPSGETEQRIDFGMLQITLDTWIHWLDNCLPAKKKRKVIIRFWRVLGYVWGGIIDFRGVPY